MIVIVEGADKKANKELINVLSEMANKKGYAAYNINTHIARNKSSVHASEEKDTNEMINRAFECCMHALTEAIKKDCVKTIVFIEGIHYTEYVYGVLYRDYINKKMPIFENIINAVGAKEILVLSEFSDLPVSDRLKMERIQQHFAEAFKSVKYRVNKATYKANETQAIRESVKEKIFLWATN